MVPTPTPIRPVAFWLVSGAHGTHAEAVQDYVPSEWAMSHRGETRVGQCVLLPQLAVRHTWSTTWLPISAFEYSVSGKWEPQPPDTEQQAALVREITSLLHAQQWLPTHVTLTPALTATWTVSTWQYWAVRLLKAASLVLLCSGGSWVLFVTLQRRHRLRHNHCVECGYPLFRIAQTAPACPECGARSRA